MVTTPSAVSLPFQSILNNYSHVVLATGCSSPRLHEALPKSPYCIPALSLVHWYTKHPNTSPPPPLDKVSHVSIIGNGNVSMDVARMLLTDAEALSQYDIPEPVLDVFYRSTVKHVSIIGRRGVLEAAFGIKELREMINLPDASMVPLDPSLLISPQQTPIRRKLKILDLLRKGSKNPFGTTSKTWSFDFFRSPIGLVPPTKNSSAQLSLSHTTLDPETGRAVPTEETSTLPTDLVITSLGFHGEPRIPFYDRELGHLRNVSGRVTHQDGTIYKNVYASGWAGTGAKGVLALTLGNAHQVADTIIRDWVTDGQDKASNLDEPPEEVQMALKEGLVTSYADWKKIDEEEMRRGNVIEKERERMGWDQASKFLIKSSTLQDD